MSMVTPPPELPSVGVVPEVPPAGAGAFTPKKLELAPSVKPRSLLRRGWEVFAENKLALVSLGVVVFMIGFCFIGPLFYRTNQMHTNLPDYLCHPKIGRASCRERV